MQGRAAFSTPNTTPGAALLGSSAARPAWPGFTGSPIQRFPCREALKSESRSHHPQTRGTGPAGQRRCAPGWVPLQLWKNTMLQQPVEAGCSAAGGEETSVPPSPSERRRVSGRPLPSQTWFSTAGLLPFLAASAPEAPAPHTSKMSPASLHCLEAAALPFQLLPLQLLEPRGLTRNQ